MILDQKLAWIRIFSLPTLVNRVNEKIISYRVKRCKTLIDAINPQSEHLGTQKAIPKLEKTIHYLQIPKVLSSSRDVKQYLARAYFSASQIYLEKGQVDRASNFIDKREGLTRFNTREQKINAGKICRSLGKQFHTTGNLAKSAEFYAKAKRFVSLDELGIRVLAMQWATDNRQDKEATSIYLKHIQSTPKTERIALVLLRLRSQCQVGEDFPRHLLSLKMRINLKVLLADPQIAWPFLYLGVIHFIQKSYDNALVKLDRSKKLDQGDFAAQIDFFRGKCYFMKRAYGTAETLFSNALDRGFLGEEIYFFKGISNSHLKTFSEAERYFEKCVEIDPLHSRARAQLALLAIQRDDFTRAGQWLEGISDPIPSELYAKALLAERLHQSKQAIELLQSYDSLFKSSLSSYRLASHRLLAAIQERRSETLEAIASLEEVLRESPRDAIAAARLGRLKLRRDIDLQSDDVSHKTSPSSPVLGLTQLRSAQQIDWFPAYDLLHRLLVSSNETPVDAMKAITKICGSQRPVFPWLRLFAHEYLREGKPQKAWELLNSVDATSSPADFSRVQSILQAWHLTTQVWSPYQVPEAKEADAEKHIAPKKTEGCISQDTLDEIEACARRIEDLHESNDTQLGQWKILLTSAVGLARSPIEAQSFTWEELSPSPLADILGLFSSDEERRKQSASVVEASIETKTLKWSNEQVLLLQALSAWARQAEHNYVACYASLGTALEHLPVQGKNLWVAAALIWYRNKNWNALLETNLPECVASLSHPRIRLILGMAYAQAATDAAQSGALAIALQRTRQSGNMLDSILG